MFFYTAKYPRYNDTLSKIVYVILKLPEFDVDHLYKDSTFSDNFFY